MAAFLSPLQVKAPGSSPFHGVAFPPAPASTCPDSKFTAFPYTCIGSRQASFRRSLAPPVRIACKASSNIAGSDKQGRSVIQIASYIGLTTVVSKVIGLLRETLLAAVFGVGPVMTAFSCSSILPGFFMAILGGINGPFHVTMVTILSKEEAGRAQSLVGKVTTAVGLVCGGLALALLAFAGPIIDVTAPGLLLQGSKTGVITRKLAILQLRLMAPCTLFAGMIGLGFGTLSAAGIYGVASLSSSLSSISIIFAVLLHTIKFGFQAAGSHYLVEGAISLSLGFSLGALAQWLWQVKVQQDLGHCSLSFQHVNLFTDKDLHEVLRLLLPAVVASGMMQFATFTDVYFASFIPGAAAGLGYANLLVMAPLGVLSSSLLVPLLSLFARLAEPSKLTQLKNLIGEGLLLVLAATLPMTAIMVPLSKPIVEVVLKRVAFDATASALVSSLLVCYVAGSSFYLARDLLVQVCYALGDGSVPFCISLCAILSNAVLDWILVQVADLGPTGLVIATSLVNMFSTIALLGFLSRRLSGLPLKKWMYSLVIMVGASILAGFTTQSLSSWWLQKLLIFRSSWVAKSSSVLLSSVTGVIMFYTIFYITDRTRLESFRKILLYRLHQDS